MGSPRYAHSKPDCHPWLYRLNTSNLGSYCLVDTLRVQTYLKGYMNEGIDVYKGLVEELAAGEKETGAIAHKLHVTKVGSDIRSRRCGVEGVCVNLVAELS